MSSSSTTTQPHSSVSLLSDVFAGENEDTKRSLCAEVGQLVDTELDSLILKLTRKLITNQDFIINSQSPSSSSSSSSSAAAPKCYLNVDELRRLLEEEKEATKVTFRGDLQRCVEPVVGSLFKRLINKSMDLELARLDSVNGGECAPVVNQTESSNAHVASLTQPPPTSSSSSGGSARLESVPLPPVCNCPNPHPHVKSIVLHREVKEEVKEEDEDDAKNLMIISGMDINNQLVEVEMKEEQDEEDKVSTGRPSSHVSIETVLYEDYIQQKNNGGGEEMCNKGGMSQKEEEVMDSLREIENGEMMMDIDEEEEVEEDGNQGREEDEDTEIDDNNGVGYDDNQSDEEEDNDDEHNKRKQPTLKRTGKRSKITIEEDEGEDGEDGDDSANEDREEAKVKVLHLNCTESKCNVKLDSLDHMKDHLSTVHRIAPLQCFATDCNARFDHSTQLGDHIQRHHPQDARFLCAVCRQECDSKHKAYVHWYKNHLNGQFQCNFVSDCAQVSDTRGKMTTHQLAKHYSQSKHFHCTHPGCSASFAFKAHLKQHESIHLHTNQFHCDWPQCNKQFKRRSNLITHIRMCHFGLPKSVKEQMAENIVDDRDPNEYVRVVVDE